MQRRRMFQTLGAAAITATLVLGQVTIRTSQAASRPPRACTYVQAADIKVLTGMDMGSPTGADNPKGSICIFMSPKGGMVTTSFFDALSEQTMPGLMVVLGKNKSIKGVTGGLLWVSDTKTGLLLRKGNKTIQMVIAGTKVTSDNTAKSFASSVIRRLP
jgi:hypothetical protein